MSYGFNPIAVGGGGGGDSSVIGSSGWLSSINSGSVGFKYLWDFVDPGSMNGSSFGSEALAFLQSNGNIQAVAANDNTVMGQARVLISTNGSSYSYLGSGEQNIILMGGAEYWYETRVNLSQLSTVSEEFQFALGFLDSFPGTTQTDAVCFLYDRAGVSTGSAASDNWQILTASNGTRTYTTTSVPVVDANTWIKLGISINAGGNLATYYIDGASVGTITTNIPTGSARYTGFANLMKKSAGTGVQYHFCDYIEVAGKFTTAR